MKAMRFASWLAANRSNTCRYREDSQRRHGAKGAPLCASVSGADHWQGGGVAPSVVLAPHRLWGRC
jgi:hypothetical protein